MTHCRRSPRASSPPFSSFGSLLRAGAVLETVKTAQWMSSLAKLKRQRQAAARHTRGGVSRTPLAFQNEMFESISLIRGPHMDS